MSETLTVTLIQTDLLWENKSANLKMLEEKITNIKERTQLIVLPEMFSTGFSMNAEALAETMDGPSIKWMKRISKEKRAIIVGSLIIKEEKIFPLQNEPAPKNAAFNRLIWMLPNGRYGVYDKRHLFAYANENRSYTPGEKRLIASVNDWKINLHVCYDLRFPVWARQASTFEYDVLIYIANWPQQRSLAWETLLQARAIENQCYVVGVNRVGNDGNNIHYSGDSMVIDPLGEICYHQNEVEDIFTIALEKKSLNNVRERFPFWKDADAFKIF